MKNYNIFVFRRKRDVYDKILLKIGEAFLVRKERRLCGDGELSKVVGSEIYGKNDQRD